MYIINPSKLNLLFKTFRFAWLKTYPPEGVVFEPIVAKNLDAYFYITNPIIKQYDLQLNRFRPIADAVNG
ncbi:MAG: hypothetical protein WCN92_13035, partial [Eubacteriales bacterium]